ncbi:MAG: hypothetical protein OK404_00720 [Thaumarchaeota archaeon]|nr:hypothetical protein [Nitrososphaerota archaeon]
MWPVKATLAISLVLLLLVVTVSQLQFLSQGTATTSSRAGTSSSVMLSSSPGTGTVKLDPFKECVAGQKVLPLMALRVAFVVPIFTLTPYSNFASSFYAFYIKYNTATGPITTDLSWLSTHITNAWPSPAVNNEKPLFDFLNSVTAANCGLVSGKNLSMIDDLAVNDGGLFSGGTPKYDVVILGHEEYVTPYEFHQFQQFVAQGGRIVAMCGNTFWGQVSYSSGVETFVAGHGFRFNGTTAWKTSYEPFDQESASWFGSTFAGSGLTVKGAVLTGNDSLSSSIKKAFHNSSAFTDYSYPHNELNYVRNTSHTLVIAKFYQAINPNNASRPLYPYVPVDAYAHEYVKGQVVDIVIFGEDIILRDQGAQYFLVAAVSSPVLPAIPA